MFGAAERTDFLVKKIIVILVFFIINKFFILPLPPWTNFADAHDISYFNNKQLLKTVTIQKIQLNIYTGVSINNYKMTVGVHS